MSGSQDSTKNDLCKNLRQIHLLIIQDVDYEM